MSKNEESTEKGRRKFMACAAMTIGAVPIVLAQEQKPPSIDVEKAVKATRLAAIKSRATQMVRYLKPMIQKYGKEALDLIRKTTVDDARNRFEKIEIANRNLDAVKELLWDKMTDPDQYEFEMIEKTPVTLKYKVSKCILAEAYKTAGSTEIGYAVSCAWDFGFCQGLNPQINFTRTKTLMEGHDCCNHSYELKKS
jgi:hypothetical protein